MPPPAKSTAHTYWSDALSELRHLIPDVDAHQVMQALAEGAPATTSPLFYVGDTAIDAPRPRTAPTPLAFRPGIGDRLIKPINRPAPKTVVKRVEQMLAYSPAAPSADEAREMHWRNNVKMNAAALSSKLGRWTAWNNEDDAIRHAEWSAKMARAMGMTAAKSFGDAHERNDTRRNIDGERLMDLINNHNGRVLRSRYPDMRGNALARWAAREGLLQTAPVQFGD